MKRQRFKLTAPVWFLTLLTVSYPVTTFVGAAIDNQRKERDAWGYLVWVSDSDFSSGVRLALMVLVGVLAIHVILTAIKGSRLRVSLSSVLWVVLILAAMFIRGDFTGALAAFVAFLALLAAMAIEINQRMLTVLAATAIGALLVAVVFPAFNPERSFIECRVDKCSALGSLLTSYMPQENVLALYATVTLALCIVALPGWVRLGSIIFCVAVIMATGSRAAIVVAIGLAALWALSLSGEAAKRMVGRVSVLSFVFALLASLAVFLGVIRSEGLTGRDFIFGIVRDGFLENPLIGPGRGILEEAFELGLSANFIIAHEHGQAPYLLSSGGVLAFLAFAGFALRVALTRGIDTTGLIRVGIISASVAAFFITEPSIQADPRSPTFWILAILVALLSNYGSTTNQILGKAERCNTVESL